MKKKGNAYQNSSTRPDSCEQIDYAIFLQEVGLAVPQLISARSDCIVRMEESERRINAKTIGIKQKRRECRNRRFLTYNYSSEKLVRVRLSLLRHLRGSVDRAGWFGGCV